MNEISAAAQPARHSPLAGQPAPASILVNVPRLVTAYYAQRPEPSVPQQRVQFGTSGPRVIGRIRVHGGNVAIVAHREILRILAVRWIGLPTIAGRRLLLSTASLSVLGYDHDLTEPVMHTWNATIGTGI